MKNLDQVCRDGANLENRDSNVAGIAFSTLRIGLRAYFSTYQSMNRSLHLFENNDEDHVKDLNTPPEYYELSTQTILHMHHFTELIIKDMLRDVHPLMADKGSTKPVVLKKMLLGDDLTDAENAGVQSVEYKEALERLCTLISAEEIDGHDLLSFFLTSRDMLNKLGTLRNRIWHRGRIVLRYDSLDIFMCFHFMPFLNQLLSIPKYSGKEGLWKYKELHSGFEPLDFLLSVGSYDIGKVAFAKEMARAAYENPLYDASPFGELFNVSIRERAEAGASAEQDSVSEIMQCSVCGVNALIVYEDMNIEFADHEQLEVVSAMRYTWQVRCQCCSFEVDHYLKNGSDYGIGVPDYWKAEEGL